MNLELLPIDTVIRTLGWTLLHFLWQGVAIGIVFALAMLVMRKSSAVVRYNAGIVCLFALLALPLVTFVSLYTSASELDSAVASIEPHSAQVADIRFVTELNANDSIVSAWQFIKFYINEQLQWAVFSWLIGVLVFSIKMYRDCLRVRQLRTVATYPMASEWQEKVDALCQLFAIKRPVVILESMLIQVPAIVGWLRPVVLIPSSALTGLSPSQLELIIAHELVHVSRNDYLINMLQMIVETLFFYHPVVSWISNYVRNEREKCCDDRVLETFGSALNYAQSLAIVESHRQKSTHDLPLTALAATGGGLLDRINRIADYTERAPRSPTFGKTLVMLGTVAVTLLGIQVQQKHTPSIAMLNVPVVNKIAPQFEPKAQSLDVMATLKETARETLINVPPATIMRDVSAQSAERGVSSAPIDDAPSLVTQRVPVGRVSEDKEALPARTSSSVNSTASNESQFLLPDASLSDSQLGLSKTYNRVEPEINDLNPLDNLPKNRDDNLDLLELVPAKVIRRVEPVYPRHARIRNISGFVTLKFLVTSSGLVENVKILKSMPKRTFDRAAKRAISKWVFQPAKDSKGPRDQYYTQTMDFNIGNFMGGSSNQRVFNNARTCQPRTGTRLC